MALSAAAVCLTTSSHQPHGHGEQQCRHDALRFTVRPFNVHTTTTTTTRHRMRHRTIVVDVRATRCCTGRKRSHIKSMSYGNIVRADATYARVLALCVRGRHKESSVECARATLMRWHATHSSVDVPQSNPMRLFACTSTSSHNKSTRTQTTEKLSIPLCSNLQTPQRVCAQAQRSLEPPASIGRAIATAEYLVVVMRRHTKNVPNMAQLYGMQSSCELARNSPTPTTQTPTMEDKRGELSTSQRVHANASAPFSMRNNRPHSSHTTSAHEAVAIVGKCSQHHRQCDRNEPNLYIVY